MNFVIFSFKSKICDSNTLCHIHTWIACLFSLTKNLKYFLFVEKRWFFLIKSNFLTYKKICDFPEKWKNWGVYQFTLPGNQQSNGKIEKFWCAIDKHIKLIPHSDLEKDSNGFNKYPSEIFVDESLRAVDMDSTFISIDQKEPYQYRQLY